MARKKTKAAQNGGKDTEKEAKKKSSTSKAKKTAPNGSPPPPRRSRRHQDAQEAAATAATPSPQESPQDKDAQILKLQQEIALLSGSNPVPVTFNLPASDQKPAAKPKKSTTGSKKITTSSKKSAKKAKKLAKKTKKSIAKSEPKGVLICKVPRTKAIEKVVHGCIRCAHFGDNPRSVGNNPNLNLIGLMTRVSAMSQ